MRRLSIIFLICTAIIGPLTGCANVSLTQRGTLAKPEMQFDFDTANARMTEQIYASKEAASGGRVTGGGGCGCT